MRMNSIINSLMDIMVFVFFLLIAILVFVCPIALFYFGVKEIVENHDYPLGLTLLFSALLLVYILFSKD